MEKFRFLQWQVYQDSRKLVTLILLILKRLPREYRFEVGSQLSRSALSVMLNIAEGCGRDSDKEFIRFINISIGSLYETLAALDMLRENKLLNENDFTRFKELINSIDNQLGGFKKKIKGQKVLRSKS